MPSEDAPTTVAPRRDPVQRRKYAATIGGLLIGGLAYFALLLDFDHHWDRLATGVGFGANFFDLQATAIRHGHLWLPDGSLGIEGFEARGHTYMYFGIFPALLRIPVQLFTDQYEARLTLPSMAIAWVVFAVMTARLYWLVRHAMGRPREVSRIEAGFAVVFLALVTGGSVIAFDASLPWVYHEVYLWSVATVVGSLYWLLRVVLEPSRRSIAWLGGFALAACLTRTTGGWAVALAVIAVGVWIATGRPHPQRRGAAPLVLAAGLLPLLAGIAVNWIRFRHPYLFPLEDQVFTHVNQHRRDALAANGGTLVGTQFLPTTINTYFNPSGIRFVDYFPWITLPAHPASALGDVVVDQSYRTGSITSFMPLLLLGTLASVPVLFRRLPTPGYRGVRVIWLAGFVMTGGVMDYGYLAYRYTSEFVPVFVVGTAVAIHAVTGVLVRRRRPRLSGAFLAVAALLTAFGMAANGAVAFQTAAINYRGEPLARYLGIQASLTGGTAAYRDLVHHGSGLPTGGSADDLWIRGDCDALYVNTGETDEPWVLVEEKDLSLLIRTAPVIGTNQIELMRLQAADPQQVWFETLPDNQARFFVRNSSGDYNGQVFDLLPGDTVRLGLRTMSELGYAEVSSTPGGFVGYLKATDITKDFKAAPTLPTYPDLDPATLTQMGIGVTREKPLDLSLCQKVAAAAGVDTTS